MDVSIHYEDITVIRHRFGGFSITSNTMRKSPSCLSNSVSRGQYHRYHGSLYSFSRRFRIANLADEKHANDTITTARNDLSAIKEFPSALMKAAKQAYMDALRAVFLTLSGLAFPGVAVSLVR